MVGPAIRPYAEQALAVLGDLIRIARTDRKWTQAHLGKVCSVDRRTIAAIENGRPEVRIGTVFNVAAVLGIPLYDSDASQMSRLKRLHGEMASLIPRRVDTQRGGAVNDDF